MQNEEAQAAGRGDGSTPHRKPERDPHLDNVRTILIVLVVVGHAAALSSQFAPELLYTWIYAFHMPAFVAVAGYLSKSFTAEPRQSVRLISTLLVPYLIFQLIHVGIRMLVDDDPFDPDLLRPAFTLWFLLSLAAWRIATPVLRNLRYPLVIAAGLSLLTPLDSSVGHWLSIGRTFAFLPFFVLGLVARPEWLAVLRTRRARAVGAAALVGLLAISPILHTLPARAFLLNASYSSLDLSAVEGITMRALQLVLGFVGTVAIVAIAPRRANSLSVVGRNSITVYLLHGLLLVPLLGTEPLGDLAGPVQAVVLAAAGTALALVLGSPPVTRFTRWLVQPLWAERIFVGYRAKD